MHALKLALPLWIRSLIRPVAYRLEKRLQSRRLRALYRAIVRPGDLVFDLGAHLGEHSEHFLAVGARVLAVEPNPECLPTLTRVQAQSYRMSLVTCAVGETEGTAELCIPEVPAHATLNPAHQQARFPTEDYSRRVPVETVPLNRLIGTWGLPDYIKIDTEGSELAILKGLRHRPRFISYEFSKENLDQAAEITSVLNPALYNVSLYSSQRFFFPEWVTASALIHFLMEYPDDFLRGDIFARLT